MKQIEFDTAEIASLLSGLQEEVFDPHYVALEGEGEPDLLVTVATTDGSEWSCQTGDNSYSGACYRHSHWAVVTLCRDSDTDALAAEVVTQLADLLAGSN